MKRCRSCSKRGQSTVELAVLFMVIAAVLLMMRIYVKRSLASKLKSSADSISGGEAYHFDTLVSDHTVFTSHSKYSENNRGGGRIDKTISGQWQNYTRNVVINDVFEH